MASHTWPWPTLTNMAAAQARILHKERLRKFPRDEFYYVIMVTWSYGGKTLTKRSYSEFFRLQCKLLDCYSDVTGIVKLLPRLPGRNFFPVSASRLAEDRIPDLNQYLHRLVRLPLEIAQSDLVLTFLEPDLNSPPDTADANDPDDVTLDSDDVTIVSSNDVICTEDERRSTDASPASSMNLPSKTMWFVNSESSSHSSISSPLNNNDVTSAKHDVTSENAINSHDISETKTSINDSGFENFGFDEHAVSSAEDDELMENSLKQASDGAVFSPCDVGDILYQQ